jgi:hypothetical protein
MVSMHKEPERGDRNSRDGRMDLAWLVAAVCAGALLAVVLHGWLPERAHSRTVDAATVGLQPQLGDSPALAEAIGKLDQRLAHIEAALAVQESRVGREEVKPSSIPAGDHSELGARPEGSDQLHNDLLQLSHRVDALTESLKESHNPSFQLPTLEQMRSARRDVDWAFVEDLRKLYLNDASAALGRVRLMSFDDVLTKVGPPARINQDGSWWYPCPGTALAMEFRFTRDYVTSFVVR